MSSDSDHPALGHDVLAERLGELVTIPTVTGSEQESGLQHLVADQLSELGCRTDLWELDVAELAADPDFPGAEVARDGGWGLVGELTAASGQDGPTVVLGAHVDVVPPGEDSLWSSPAFSPDRRPGPDGRDTVFGRGSCDMKAGLVAIQVALELLRSRGGLARGRVLVHSVVGEEDGGLGTFATLRRGHVGDVAVVPEPTSCQLVVANAGALTFRLTVPGRAAHGSSRRDGVSAVEAFWPLWQALQELEDERDLDVDPLLAHLDTPYGISIGTVSAGDWVSSVPDLLVAQGRLGVRLGEDVGAARAALLMAVDRACSRDLWLARHPATVEFTGGQYASSRTDPEHPLVREVRGAHAALTGADPSVLGAPYGSDARLLNAAGMPTVHYGPGSVRNAHAPDEHVPLSEVVQTARVLADLVESYCGAAAPDAVGREG